MVKDHAFFKYEERFMTRIYMYKQFYYSIYSSTINCITMRYETFFEAFRGYTATVYSILIIPEKARHS